MLGEQRAKALARAGREGGNDHAFAPRLQALHMRDGRREDIGAFARALGGERAARTAAVRVDRAPGVALLLEGREVADGVSGQGAVPFPVGEEHRVRRYRLVGRRAEALRFEAVDARLIVVADQGEPLAHGFVGQMIEADGRLRRVVEQGFEALVEQRQPVLHAGIALPGAHGFIERIGAGRRAELLDVAAAEQLLAGLAQRHLADRHQGQALHELAGALGLGIEGLHLLQRVAEEIEAHRRRAAGRVEIEDAAAHRVFAGLHDRAAAREARQIETPGQLAHVEPLARRDGFQRAADELARRHALQDGVDGGEDDGGVLAGGGGEPRQRRNAPRHNLAVGPDAVIGHRVPGRKRDDAHLGRKEREALGNGLQPPVVAGDVQEQRRGAAADSRLLGKIAEQERHEPVGHARQHLARAGGRGEGVLLCCGAAIIPIRERCGAARSAPRIRRRAQSRDRGSCRAARDRAFAAAARIR